MNSFLQIVIIACCLSVCKLGVFSYSLFDNRTFTLSDSETEPSLPRNRSGRLFFDELFGLGGYTDRSEESADNSVRTCGCECGVPNEQIRIVGGFPTGINQYPWMARIVYDGKFHCGASILTKYHVLTAAHCVKKLRKSRIRVILGDHDAHVNTETHAIQRAVVSIIRHRKFDPETYNNDIAILKLRKPIDFSKTMRPICLPRVNYDPAGHVGTVVGWGRTSEGGELPNIVNQVKVPILTLDECKKQKYKPTRITTSMVCAGRANMDSCQGDSGGPLLLSNGDRFYIVGIVSWGVGCGRAGYPGVYSRVSKFVPWIKANLEDSCLCA